MKDDIVIAGYQGPRSILTRGLTAFAEASLPSATLTPDVTAIGNSAGSLFEGLESGTYHVGYMASGYLAGRVPELGVLDIPFSVSDRQEAVRRLDGQAGEVLAKAVSDHTELEVLAFWDNGFRHITNAVRPIYSPADCEGLKIRTLNNRTYASTMASLGFEPVITDVKELAQACQTGRVDAQENPLTNMLTFGLERWHKHVSLTGHIFGVVLLVAYKTWFNDLSLSDREHMRSAADASARLQRRLAVEEDVQGLKALKAKGVRCIAPNELDLAAFRTAVAVAQNTLSESVPRSVISAYLE